MNEKEITVSIYDLNISDKARGVLARAGLMKLSDLLSSDIDRLSDMYGIPGDVYRELCIVIARANEITACFVERVNRIAEILPEVQDTPIENLELSTRSYNALRRAGIHTVGSLIQLSQKDLFELRNVGVLSREEITRTIENVIRFGITAKVSSNRQPASDTGSPAEGIDHLHFSTRAYNALMRNGITTVEALVKLTEEELLSIRNVGQKTRDEIVDTINTVLEQQRACAEKHNVDGSMSIDRKTEVYPDPDEVLALAFADKGLFFATDVKRRIAIIRGNHPEVNEETLLPLLFDLDEVRKQAKTAILHKLEESNAMSPVADLYALFPDGIKNTAILNQSLESWNRNRSFILKTRPSAAAGRL